MPIGIESIVQVSANQVSSELGGQTAVLNLKTGVYYDLDAVGTRVWGLLQEPRAVAQICDVIVDEYEVERDQCERELLEILGRLSAAGLLTVYVPQA